MAGVRKLQGEVIIQLHDSFERLHEILDLMEKVDEANASPNIDTSKAEKGSKALNKSVTEDVAGVVAKLKSISQTTVEMPGIKAHPNLSSIATGVYQKAFSAAEPAIHSLVYGMGILNGSYGKYIDYSKHVDAVTGDLYKNPVKSLQGGFENLTSKIGGTIGALSSSKEAIAGVSLAMAGLIATSEQAALKYEKLKDIKDYVTEGMSATNTASFNEFMGAKTAFVGSSAKADMMATMKSMFGKSLKDSDMISMAADVSSAYGSSAYLRDQYSPEAMMNMLAMGSARAAGSGSGGGVGSFRLGKLVKEDYFNTEKFQAFKDTLQDQVGAQFENPETGFDESGFAKMAEMKWAQRNLQKGAKGPEYAATYDDQSERLEAMKSGVVSSLGQVASPILGGSFQKANDLLDSFLDKPWGQFAAGSALVVSDLGHSAISMVGAIAPAALQLSILTSLHGAETSAMIASIAARVGLTGATVGGTVATALSLPGKATATALSWAHTGATWAHTAATGAWTVATGTATAAQWLLNVALNANPIGLAILGIAALVGILAVLEAKTGFVTKAWSSLLGVWHQITSGKIDMGGAIGVVFQAAMFPMMLPLYAIQAFLRIISKWKLPDWLQNLISKVEDTIASVIGLPASIGQAIWDFICDPIGKITGFLSWIWGGISGLAAKLGVGTGVASGESTAQEVDWLKTQKQSSNSSMYYEALAAAAATGSTNPWKSKSGDYKGVESLSIFDKASGDWSSLGTMSKDEDYEHAVSLLEIRRGGKEDTPILPQGTPTPPISPPIPGTPPTFTKQGKPYVTFGDNGTFDVYDASGVVKTGFVSEDEAKAYRDSILGEYVSSHVGSRIMKGGMVNVAAGQEIPGPASLIKDADTPLRSLLGLLVSGRGSEGGAGGPVTIYNDFTLQLQTTQGGNIDVARMKRDLVDAIADSSKTVAHRNLRGYSS